MRVPRTFRGRLVALGTATAAAMCLFVFLYLPERFEKLAERAAVDKARSVAAMTAFTISPALVFNDRPVMEEAFIGARRAEELIYIVVTDSALTVVAHDGPAPAPLPAMRGETTIDGDVAHVSEPIRWHGGNIGRLHLGWSLLPVRADEDRARVVIGAVSLVIFLLVFGAILAISRLMTGPLNSMVGTVETIAAGDLRRRAPVTGPVEFVNLANAFNAMVDRLEGAQTQLEESNLSLERRVASRTSELESTQRMLMHAQKMEAVGRLAGGVAHDFNNLLTAIIVEVELAIASLPEGDPTRDDLAEVLRAAGHGKDLTMQLLAFGRKQVLRPRQLDLGQLVADMHTMLHRLIGEDVELRIVGSKGLWSVHADPSQIQQVIMNLVVNARDAMPKGGVLSVETRNLSVDEKHALERPPTLPGDYVLLCVRDTGVGMTPEVRAHLFEPFFTTKGVGQGTGLGLATVYGIVKQSGGFVWVETQQGVGSEFQVYLPVSDFIESDTGTHAVPLADSTSNGTETVLVVEDEEQVRRAACRVLSRRGYNVISAPNGWVALQRASGNSRIDALVTDVVMPGISGFQLAAELQRERPELRVLFVSGYPAEAIEATGGLPAGTPLVPKPYTGDVLAGAVRQLLDGVLVA